MSPARSTEYATQLGCTALMVFCVALAFGRTEAAKVEPAANYACSKSDDTVRPYNPSLRAGFLNAYRQLFPHARMPPDETQLQAGAATRCMDGRLLACFTGANLPCSKMNTARDNTGANAFCRTNLDADGVPAFATGHDSAYRYRCMSGRAKIVGTIFVLDQRGFAASLWAPME